MLMNQAEIDQLRRTQRRDLLLTALGWLMVGFGIGVFMSSLAARL